MEDQDENITELYDGKKNIAIILIDVAPTMFEDKTKTFKQCIGACFRVMEKILLRTYRKNICICFMRDDDIVLTQFSDNLVHSAKELLKLCQTKNEDLIPKYQRTQPLSLHDTLTKCLQLLSRTANNVNPYVVLLTNDDDPHRGDQNKNLSAFHVANSFKEMDARLVVLPLKDKFNLSLFYTELMKNANALPLEVFEEAEEESYLELSVLIEMLDAIICDTQITHRQQFELYEKIDGKETKTGRISVKMSYYASKHHLYKNCTKSRKTGNIVKKMWNRDSSDQLKLNVKKGSNEVVFDKADQRLMRMQMPYGFRMLYITGDKQSSIHRQKRMNFIIQKDEMSTLRHQNLFDHMWEYCRDKNRYVVAGYMVPGYKQVPNLVELSPAVQQNKPAFIGHFLVNCDELNRFPASVTQKWIASDSEQKPNSSNDPKLKAVCDMIDQLTIRYEPREWKDPKYEQKAVFLRAQLLNTEPESFQSCIPTKQDVEKRLGNTMQTLKMVCPEFFPDIDSQPPKKRARTAGRGRGK